MKKQIINISDLSYEAIAYLKKKAKKYKKTKNNTPERGNPTSTTPVSDPEPKDRSSEIHVGGNELFYEYEMQKLTFKEFMEKNGKNPKN